jgi:acetyl esterase/lipase
MRASEPFFEEAQPVESGVRYRSSITRTRGIAPLGDAYAPRHRTDGASVVLVHGGGFVVGSRRMLAMRHVASRLIGAGVGVFAIDYRMLFRGGGLDEALEDVLAATDHWSARCDRYGLDPSKISLAGLSAGATLSFLAAARAEGRIRTLTCVFGLYELDGLRGPLASWLPRLLLRTSDDRVWRARSPAHSAQPSVPTLLLHGTADGLVEVSQARRLAARRRALGLPTRLVEQAGAPHAYFNWPSSAADEAVFELARHVRGENVRGDEDAGEG